MANVAGNIIINHRHNLSYCTSCLCILLTNAWCTQPQKEDATSGREKGGWGYSCIIFVKAL